MILVEVARADQPDSTLPAHHDSTPGVDHCGVAILSTPTVLVQRGCRHHLPVSAWQQYPYAQIRQHDLMKRSSLACPQYHHHHRDQAHSRLTSAITAPQTPRWRPPATGDYASQPLTGTRRAALLGTCARARATRRHAPSDENATSFVA